MDGDGEEKMESEREGEEKGRGRDGGQELRDSGGGEKDRRTVEVRGRGEEGRGGGG